MRNFGSVPVVMAEVKSACAGSHDELERDVFDSIGGGADDEDEDDEDDEDE